MFFRYVRFLPFFLVLLLFWNCSNRDNKDQIVQPEKVQVSIPEIHELNSPIYFNFNQIIIPEESEVSDYLKKRKNQETTDNSDSSAISVSNEEIISEINRIKTDIISKVTFIPPLKGDFEWESNRVLKFDPEKNQIGWGARINININPVNPFFGEQYTSSSLSRTLELPQYQVGSKAANWNTILGAPRFIAPLGYKAYAHLIGKGAYYLLYDQPLDLDLIRQHLRLTKGDKSELSYTLKHPDNIGNEFNLDIDDNYVVSIYIDEALEEGDRLYLSIPSWKELPESGNPEFQSYYLTYNSYFALKDIYYENKLSSGRLELDSNIILNFSSDFNLSEFRNGFSIHPEPQNLNIYSYNSNSVYLDLKLDPGIEYNMTLDEDFTDYLNNKLDSPFSVTFRAQDLVPVFTIPNKPITVESGNKSIPFKGINIESVQLNVYEFSSAADYINAMNSSNERKTAKDYGISSKPISYDHNLTGWTINDGFSDSLSWKSSLSEGFKCFELSAQTMGSESSGAFVKTILVNVSDIGITAKVSQNQTFAWLASFSDAEVLTNVPVKLYNSRGDILESGNTDKIGIANFSPLSKYQNGGKEENRYLVANNKSIMVLKNEELSSPWQFNLPGVMDDKIPLTGSIFTERGVYRPGDKVYIKTYTYSESFSNMSITVKDPRSKEILKSKLVRDEFGGSDFEIDISSGAAVGRYDIIVSNGSSYISGSFKVEEYRVPTFVVSLNDNNQQWNHSEPVKIDIESKYYHGGIMGNRNFTWKVTRSQVPLNLKAFPDYLFQSAEDETASGLFTSGSDVLNGEGKQSVSFIPEHRGSAGRMLYTFDAVVVDTDRQAYSSRISSFVHPADIYIGVKPPAREVVRSDTKVDFPFIVVDTKGGVIEKVSVDITVEYIKYHSSARQYDSTRVQLFNRMVGEQIHTESIISDSVPQNFTYTPAKAGIYRLNFDSTDSKGNMVRTSTYLTVSGDESTAWPRFDMEKIDIVKDKEEYKIGDTAHLIPQTPYKEATGLLTIERSGIIESKIIRIDNNTPDIEIPILPEYAPNVFISFVIVRSREHFMKDASGFETGAPGFKIGYVKLDVNSSRQELNVLIDNSFTNVSPGQDVIIPIKITDYENKGVKAQLTAMVVDEAVLDMTGYETPNPIFDIYKPQALGVKTGSNWLDLPHSRRERLETIFPDGDGEFDFSSRSDLEAILRNLFKSTAYWNPNLITNSNGISSISFKMPDNLTSYRVMIVAADTMKRFGSSDQVLINQQPLMIQPVIPRFMYPEDELQVEAMVFNNTSSKEKITVKGEFEGIRLLSGSDSVQVTIEPGKSANIPFKVKAGTSGGSVIRFIASSSSNRDAGEFIVPIISPGTKITDVKSIKAANGSQIMLNLPEYYIEGTASCELVLSVTELTELKGAVQYLMRYPNGCIEQTTSTAYPLVVLKDLLPVIGIEVDQEELKKFSDAGIERILSFQTSKGGLAYWPGSDEPHAFATAFGLTALIAAKQNGYDIPDSALSGMADYLEMALRTGHIDSSMPHGGIADGDTRALFVMTLGRLGRPQPQYINALWDKRSELTGFGLSFLAISVSEMKGGDQSLLQPILEAIKKETTRTNDEAYFTRKSKGGWSMDSPLRTHGASLIAYGAADTDREMNSKLIDGLLARRVGNMWGNTQENVFGIMGIYESLGKSSGSGNSVPDVSIILNDKDIPLSSMEAPDSQVRRITYSDSEMDVEPGDRIVGQIKGNVSNGYLSLRLNYEIPLKYADLSSVSKGFTIERIYETVKGKPININEIPLGSLVKVRIRVEADQQYNYVAIDDKLPAGLEPLNTTLETTERVEQGKLSQEAQKGLSVLSYQEIRDSRVAFFVDEMLAGDYEFTYIARATTPGTFLRPSGHVEAMYATDHYGNTSAEKVTVK